MVTFPERIHDETKLSKKAENLHSLPLNKSCARVATVIKKLFAVDKLLLEFTTVLLMPYFAN